MSGLWELVGIDLTGPFPETSNGFLYILTATDYFLKWVEAFPLRTKTAREVGLHICSVVYRHGCPQRILSDQGREFVNDVCGFSCANIEVQSRIFTVVGLILTMISFVSAEQQPLSDAGH